MWRKLKREVISVFIIYADWYAKVVIIILVCKSRNRMFF